LATYLQACLKTQNCALKTKKSSLPDSLFKDV
jgi:hypothetical protein